MADQAPETAGRLRHLTVRSAARDFALEYAATRKKLSNGQPRFVRVSARWSDRAEAQLKAWIRSEIDRLPSKGRTIK